MTRAEEYRLSQYQHLGALREDKSIDLVRNQQTGLIGVQKVISSELYPVYLFLKEYTNPYLPVIYECIQLDGTISPGKKMDGMVGFEVPKDWKTMEIHFKDDVWSNSKFKFEIEK
ncbi:DUF4352 domain-containing protein [Blautia faecicola]|uniref:DUF4352 domain-containing protein n=1 Tax=Blautia faecicola TaxID=2509240 RepID=A0A4Q1RHQ4_9FIRM|nr:DUF4352 domain-containing protein [Blautia faecicola]RXS75221.1 DUF4352 domain-containing protein [Blautia faecicola]